MATHLAAVCPGKGQPFELQTRPTPKPGPDELLIAVKSVALNPADAIMRDTGLFIPTYPTVTGFDLSGLVLEIGDNVPTRGPGAFRPGITRVAAYAASVWKECDPDYGAFQERCLVPWQHVVVLPDVASLSWNSAATLPVAVEVALNAWDILGIPRLGEGEAQTQQKPKKEALLIWGASSSVGSMGVQTARLLRDDPTSCVAAVYATAGSPNHRYIRSLGADRVFHYNNPQIVDVIASAASEDGVVIRHCFLATGQLAPCQRVLSAFLKKDQQGVPRREDEEVKEPGKIASAPPVPADAEVVDGLETVFVLPATGEMERLKQFKYWLGKVLRENLANGGITPSPKPVVVGKGLGAINEGLDKLLQGVSCSKLVVEVDTKKDS